MISFRRRTDSRTAVGGKVCRWTGDQDDQGREPAVVIGEVSGDYFTTRSHETNARSFDGLGDGAYTYGSVANSGQQILSIGFNKSGRFYELTGRDFPTVPQEGMIEAAQAAFATA